MAYSFQTFSIGQVLTAAQMNQVEASIRDHVHGVAGVTATLGAVTVASLATVSGGLSIVPAANAAVAIGDATAGNTQVINLYGGSSAGKGVGLSFIKSGYFFGISDEASLTASGTSNVPCFQAGSTYGMKWMVNNSTTSSMELSSSGVFSCTAPIFATNITTPAIYTATGDLNLYAASQVVSIADDNMASLGALKIRGGSNTGKGSYLQFYKSNVVTGGIGNESGLLSGTGSHLCYFAGTGLGHKWYVNGNSNPASPSMELNSSGVLSTGTVPLARMMRTEVQGNTSAADYITLDLGSVVAGDRILLTGSFDIVLSSGTTQQAVWEKSSGTATIDFAGKSTLFCAGYTPGNVIMLINSGVCRVTGTGTLILKFGVGTGGNIASRDIHAHAIVLNNG